jgi:hypothetical protein
MKCRFTAWQRRQFPPSKQARSQSSKPRLFGLNHLAVVIDIPTALENALTHYAATGKKRRERKKQSAFISHATKMVNRIRLAFAAWIRSNDNPFAINDVRRAPLR